MANTAPPGPADTLVRADRPAAEEEILLAADPSVRARRRETLVVVLARVLVGIGFLVAWELASGTLVSEYWISSPTEVASALVRLWEDEGLGQAIAATLTETAVGFALGASAAIVTGIVLAANRVVARIADPYMVAFTSIPRVALIPLLILWFGVGFRPR
jgi:NitT/TauT family transport system permease protein